jgi:hypothetical protein
MATRRFKVSVGEGSNDVTEEAGAAVNSDTVELTVELATTAVNDSGSTRAINKSEILLALKKIETAIMQSSTIPS